MIDINEEDLKTVQTILKRYIPKIPVWAFGSRVTGKARQFSDLDLVMITTAPLNFDIVASIKLAFSESDLPFKVDLVDWSATPERFKKIIQENYEVIQCY